MYELIFLSNVLRELEKRGMSKNELARQSGVSVSFISEMTRGMSSPTLRTMEQIAAALGQPLPWLLDRCEEKVWRDLALEPSAAPIPQLPRGFERVGAVLPADQAAVVRSWDVYTRRLLKDKSWTTFAR